MAVTIRAGNNIDLLKHYPDNHFDSIVTDSPYGFGKEPNAAEMITTWVNFGYLEVKGKGFMGNEWDAFVPQPVLWKECLRVLKPGGYLLSFFGTRTYDWGTMAIRLAGFEIRDIITYHYGSGFPKSLDVAKAIDKIAGVERKITKEALGKKKPGLVTDFDNRSSSSREKRDIPATDSAKKYEGYGTSLKPATEPICVARKPLQGNVAENVLKYGTGGINLDDCRIETNEVIEPTFTDKKQGLHLQGLKSRMNGNGNGTINQLGRFPANVIFDPFMAAVLDEQTGMLTSGKPSGKRNAKSNIYGVYQTGQDVTGFGDSGSASRFFYCAKASQDERNAGCEHLIKKEAGMTSNTSGQHITRRDEGGRPDPVANFHPTVKPISLMRYLQRLVTPKGGLILDPFAGSGTSGCAAAFEGFDIVLIEREEAYIPIIEARTAYWQKKANREKYIQDLKESQLAFF